MRRARFALAALVTLTADVAVAQSALETSILAYCDCVWRSARQITAAIPAVAVEQAFQACATEESIVYWAAVASGVPAARVQMSIAGWKLQIKREIAEALKGPR